VRLYSSIVFLFTCERNGLIAQEWHSDEAPIRQLRDAGLVRQDASDRDLHATFRRAREEHAALPPGQQKYNSPHERVRVFLAPFLSEKGKAWAVPLESLKLPDEDGHSRSSDQASWWEWRD
jgi:hypothetical protein